jgi:hypothetical protein
MCRLVHAMMALKRLVREIIQLLYGDIDAVLQQVSLYGMLLKCVLQYASLLWQNIKTNVLLCANTPACRWVHAASTVWARSEGQEDILRQTQDERLRESCYQVWF